MNEQKFIQAIEARLADSRVDVKIINYVIGKVKQSFRNGVSVGEKQMTEKLNEK